ncbi:BTB/POZ domain-containing protein 9-like isoform X2, partial [Dinothrombium tinctorium]
MVYDYYLSEKFSDVCFVVEGEKIFAHKFILAASCQYFHTLLFGETIESKLKEIVLKNPSKRVFKAVLQFAYKRKADTNDFTVDEM